MGQDRSNIDRPVMSDLDSSMIHDWGLHINRRPWNSVSCSSLGFLFGVLTERADGRDERRVNLRFESSITLIIIILNR